MYTWSRDKYNRPIANYEFTDRSYRLIHVQRLYGGLYPSQIYRSLRPVGQSMHSEHRAAYNSRLSSLISYSTRAVSSGLQGALKLSLAHFIECLLSNPLSIDPIHCPPFLNGHISLHAPRQRYLQLPHHANCNCISIWVNDCPAREDAC